MESKLINTINNANFICLHPTLCRLGVTENVYKRFDEHQDGKHFGSYTFSRRPLQLVYFCQFMDIEQAIEFEKKIKKWSQAKKLALIEGRYEDLPNLAKKKFDK